MGRKENEPFLDFKSRMMDPISKTYCAAKWYNATIWLGHGQTTSCHHPPGHSIDPKELITNPSAIHNTQHKKLMRKYMQEGQRPAECEYCWKVEDIGRNNISDRIYKTEIFSDEDIQNSSKIHWKSDVALRTLEISFDRICNFACSYCNPAFSTSWVKDISTFGPYQNIQSDGRGHFIDTAPWAQSTSEEQSNPYIQAFWKWWESELQDSLQEIRITGGEPLMAAGVWRLFDWFKNNPERSKRLRFAVNSNLVPRVALLDKLIEMSHHVPHLEIYTSNESVGPHAEYIRDGMRYAEWKNNIHRLAKEGNLKRLHIMMTINSLCLSSITDFMDEMLELKRQYGRGYPTMSLNILRFPSFQSAAILPSNIKSYYRDRLDSWLKASLEKNETDASGNSLITPMESAQIQRLIDYLDVVKTPHVNTSEQSKLWNDFKSFYSQYDIRRGKSFESTFPEMFVDFFKSMNVDLPTKEEILSGGGKNKSFQFFKTNPATSSAGYISDELKKS